MKKRRDEVKDKLTAEDYKFMDFISSYNRSYGTQEEYMFRQEIFLAKDAEYKAIKDKKLQNKNMKNNLKEAADDLADTPNLDFYPIRRLREKKELLLQGLQVT